MTSASPPRLPAPIPAAAPGAAALAAAARIALLAAAVAIAALGPGAAQTQSLVVENEEHCVVNVRADDPLNMRAGPGTGHRVVTTLPYGACGIFVVARAQGGWVEVENGHYAGYVNGRYLSMVSPARYCVVDANGRDVPLRAFPDERSRVVTRVSTRDCGLSLLPYETNGWRKIRAYGYEGWVPARILTGQ